MKTFLVNSLMALSAVICLQQPNLAHAANPQKTDSGSLAPMLDKVMPAVVNLTIQGDVNAEMLIKQQSRGKKIPKTPRKFQSIGSGVIINTERGLIVTNAHVVKHAKTIDVTLHDGRRLKSKLIGVDPASDLAVVQIKAKNLRSLPIANSNKLRVGDFVVAIGNPFGLNPQGTNLTATFGIVSATQRSDLRVDGGVENFIQTDAAINPGNSGGALVNVKGQLVGINTAIISPYGGNVGIGLAIPSNMMLSIARQLVQYGSVKRGLMGIFVQQLTPELADALKLTGQQGALVTQVGPNSPAAKSGLKTGDVIVAINQNRVADAAQVKSFSGLLRVGSVAHLRVFRDGKVKNIDVKIQDQKSHEEDLIAKDPFFYGVALRNFEQDSSAYGIIKGVQVVGVAETAPARRGGLMPGDVIVNANARKVQSLADLHKATVGQKKQLLLRVLRGPGAMFVLVKN